MCVQSVTSVLLSLMRPPFLESACTDQMLKTDPEDSETVRRATILVIDDDRVIRETLQRVFSKTYECDISDGSAQVWEALERQTYNVIITDVAMPGTDGLHILKRIRANHSDTMVIVISGSSEQFRDLFLEMGAFAYFTKPFLLDELEASVTRAINSIAYS